jgi:hypothetical protein
MSVPAKYHSDADFAGELYFDLPLVNWMQQSVQVIYVVKPSPVQDDLTLEDVKRSGLQDKFGKVMSTGIASPGVVFFWLHYSSNKNSNQQTLHSPKAWGIMRLCQNSPRKGNFSIALWPSATQ